MRARLPANPAILPATDPPRWMRIGLPIAMLLAVLLVYIPPGWADPDTSLLGIDYENLHIRRIRFAQQALASGGLPGWYPREFLGTPFWSNVQNFPFIPSRWPLLLLDASRAYWVGVSLNACLAALFTYLYLRQIGLHRAGAAIAGWTFACSGEFAARVLAGHLVSLEGYPSLPLLLWLIERALARKEVEGDRINRRLIALGVAACCVALTPHPQFPAYSFIVAGIYAIYRTWPRLRQSLPLLLAVGVGVGMAAFALLPMFLLIRRSTRVLDLAAAGNDVSFAYERLLAFILPWKQGWSALVRRAPFVEFTAGPHEGYFWDTVCYTGLLPVVGFVAAALLHMVRRWKMPAVGFLLLAGAVALFSATPAIAEALDKIPGTYFRSPARQVYITVFALAVAGGAVVHQLLAWGGAENARRRIVLPVVTGLLLWHLYDLGRHSRAFIVSMPIHRDEQLERAVRNTVGDGRLGMDYTLRLPLNRSIDDAGFFDSIILARTYAGLLAMEQFEPRLNIQDINASALRARTLATFGVRLLVTTAARADLVNRSAVGGLNVYRIADSAPRAAFFPEQTVARLSDQAITERLRDQEYDPRLAMMLPSNSPAAPSATRPSSSGHSAPAVQYRRPGPDEIEVHVEADQPGYVRIIESWDSGWSAVVDETPARVLPADNLFLAVPVQSGTHVIRLRFATPGAAPGILTSLLCAGLLLALSHRTIERRLLRGAGA